MAESVILDSRYNGKNRQMEKQRQQRQTDSQTVRQTPDSQTDRQKIKI